MECPICFYNWNTEANLPVILACGHSVCINCCRSLFAQKEIVCPTCSGETQFGITPQANEQTADFTTRCIESLTKNYTLLSLVPQKSSIKSRVSKFRYGMKCNAHDLLIHSYVAKPFSMLCSSCIDEIKEMNLKVVAYPEAIEKARVNIECLQKNIKNIKEALETTEENSEELILKEFEEHFNGLQLRVKEANERALDNLHEKIKNFQGNSRVNYETAKRTLRDIKKQEQKVTFFKSMTLGQVLHEKQFIDSLLINLRKEYSLFSFPAFSISVQFKQDSLNLFKDFTRNSLSIRKKKVHLKEKWECRRCGLKSPEGKVQCVCGSFRPLNSYPSVLTSPLKCSDSEIAELQQRRDIEIHWINQLDESKECGTWYLINADWINSWKSFVLNKSSRPGANLGSIGILPPGAINNSVLLKENGDLIPKLKPAVHYRAINKSVWDAYVLIYGGGPAIIRKSLNIYE